MRLWSSLMLLVMLTWQLDEGLAGYKRDFCICQLDTYLQGVKKTLGKKENVTYVTTTEAPTITTEAQTIATEAPTLTRKKREVATDSKNYDNGVTHPFGKTVVFDTGLKMIENSTGVTIYKNGTAELCNCIAGSFVRGKICLLNLNFHDDFKDPKSARSKRLTSKLLPWLDMSLYNAMKGNKGLYIRVYMEKYLSFKDQNVHVVFRVELNKTYVPDIVVHSALELALRHDNILQFETDINDEDNGCVATQDLTPVEIIDNRILSNIRYVFIAVGFAFVVLIILCTCCGSGDKFYIRFW